MTERLYERDAYITDFDAAVLACQTVEGGFSVLLTRTAFYPTGGGQPHDTGTIQGARVSDVHADHAGDVWHLIDRPLTVGEAVHGQIDWARRFDHMQQHAGDHLMAGVIHHMLGGFTVGLHLGEEASTIDVVLPDGRTRLDEAELLEIERRVNDQIERDLPIRCWFPTEAEMADIPLRKDPTVAEHIRVVEVPDAREAVACGGTHPNTTGQIGLLKILDARPSRGKLRITFVAGARAVRDYQAVRAAAERAAASLSTSIDQLPGAVERLLERVKDAEYQLRKAAMDAALKDVQALESRAEPLPGGWRAAHAVIPGADMAALREVAAALTAGDRMVALLASQAGDGAQILFARSGDPGPDMGALLRAVCAAQGGKGGGKGDFAQGASHGQAAIEDALRRLSASTTQGGSGT